MVKVGIIGYGYWGPNLVRNFNAHKNCQVTYVSDKRDTRLELVANAYPGIKTTVDYNDLIDNKEVDAVIIATPVFTHFDLAKTALNHGKHVFVEKPMASSSAECLELIELAREKNKVLMVDHTFLYTGAVSKLKGLIENNELGKLSYIDSTRINLGLFQPDVNVLWDLAPHDLSIISYLYDKRPVSVNATGISHVSNGIENIAFLTLNYETDFIAHVNCSWTSPVKVRSMLIGGDQKMAIYNDVEPTEKIKIYDAGVVVKNDDEKDKFLVDYRMGDIYVPKIPNQEALYFVADDFVSAILKGIVPKSSAALGAGIVHVLEAAEKSIKHKGQEILL